MTCTNLAFANMRMLWGGFSRATPISEAVKTATEAFRRAGVSEPAASAEWLAVHVFDAENRGRAVIRKDKSMPSLKAIKKFAALCREREQNHVPVQYLVGEWEFHRIKLIVRPPVLIPRPETEELVEHVMRCASSLPRENLDLPGDLRVLDVGCGSGAIVLALLVAHPTWFGMGVDISEDAIALSRENRKKLHIVDRCDFDCADLDTWAGLEVTTELDLVGVTAVRRRKPGRPSMESQSESKHGTRLFDILVSNPPYIPSGDMASLPAEVADHEDPRALAGGGEDGLDVIRVILRRAQNHVRRGGRIWLEVDPSQPAKIRRAVKEDSYSSLRYLRTAQDFCGKDRFCELEVTK